MEINGIPTGTPDIERRMKRYMHYIMRDFKLVVMNSLHDGEKDGGERTTKVITSLQARIDSLALKRKKMDEMILHQYARRTPWFRSFRLWRNLTLPIGLLIMNTVSKLQGIR